MNQKNKIIIYISAILVIVLSLLGFTYGYYLTKVVGNTSAKSITIVTSTSSVDFVDKSQSDISEVINPGYTNTKVFTIENIGDDTAIYSIYLREVTNQFIRTQDITYTLYRNVGNNTIDTSNLNDYTVISNGTFPITDQLIIADETLTTSDKYYTYALHVEYKNLVGIDQSDDMGHIFGYRIQVSGSEYDLNPYSEGTLAYSVINNSLLKINGDDGTIYSHDPKTIVSTNISDSTERILTTTEDDYGTSYYYRGDIKDNYLTLNNMCFRIVRVEGDGSVKLMLADGSAPCSVTTTTNTSSSIGTSDYGIKNSIYGDLINSSGSTTSIKSILDTWINTNFPTPTTLLKSDKWCIGDLTNTYDDTGTLLTQSDKENVITNNGVYYYDSAKRTIGIGGTRSASLICGYSTILNYVGVLSVDEVIFAGASYENQNNNIYLDDNMIDGFWLSNLVGYNNAIEESFIFNNGNINKGAININTNYVVPTITLLSSTNVTGTGTLSNPYMVVNNES